jgi:catechol 2,3-dioxygenase-like lactoylglutathione lyase family enzyme
MKRVTLVKLLVSSQDEALKFYTRKPGFEVADDSTMRDYRWLMARLPDNKEFCINVEVAKAGEQKVLVSRQAVGLPLFSIDTSAVALEASGNVLRREGQYWTVCFAGSLARLTDAKGLRYLARLLADPGREFHAVDLAAADSHASRPPPAWVRDAADGKELAVRPDLGDAGALLDAKAKAAYKERLAELQAELDEAERCNDPARAATATAERDFLVDELARAVGLGGRDRRAASHAERARLNVTRAIRAAMANLTRANPALGAHLAATIRTGRYCCYAPDPRVPITWEL